MLLAAIAVVIFLWRGRGRGEYRTIAYAAAPFFSAVLVGVAPRETRNRKVISITLRAMVSQPPVTLG
jgi:hypothetical protein